MTRTTLDKELHDLDAQMLRLGSLVDTALAQALEALETSDQDKAGMVVVSDAPISVSGSSLSFKVRPTCSRSWKRRSVQLRR